MSAKIAKASSNRVALVIFAHASSNGKTNSYELGKEIWTGMSQKEKLPLKGYMFLGAILFLLIVGALISWRLLTANYPTHSDIFFIGVEAGFLAFALLACLFLIGFFLYRLAMVPKRKS